MLDPVVEQIVVNHYSPEESARAGRPRFMVKVPSRSTLHHIAVVDIREFAGWLKRSSSS